MSRYMLVMRDSAEAYEASQHVDFAEIIAAMGAYNEALEAAGVLVASEGLSDPSESVVIDFSSADRVATDGPYGEVHELFNGFWVIETATKEEAVAWGKRCPLGPGSKLEVRRFGDASDLELGDD
ncbi:YciI family protein [Aeromicrobium alkaliterrae]